MQSVFEEEAIPFIQLDTETNEYTVNEDVFDFLKELEAPIGIVAVAGMYRTGKSYLLNRMLLNRQSGFGVGPTVNACTKGLWIWKKPIAGFTPDGDPINVLVIDTEGLGAVDEDCNHDSKIFSLALLISSYFIYNSVGSIDESALNNLNLVVNLTKHIHVKTQGTGEDIDPEEYARYFPAFMWVVRDFTLQLVDEEGEAISSKDYFEKSLDPQKGFSDSIEQKNRIRRMLKSFFPERDCCTMVRPLTKEEDLQNLEKMKLEELRPEFVEQVMQLRRKVINRIKPKTLNGKKLSGEMLINLAQTYIAAINKGVVPNIENAWSYICKNECVKAFHNALEKYDITLKELAYSKIPMEEQELKQYHREARQVAINDFSSKAVGPIASDYMKDLLLKLKQKYGTIRTENEKETRKTCQVFLSSAYMSTEKKLKNSEFETYAGYEKELKAFQLYFLEQGPQGPNRRTIMLEFCQRALNEASDFFSRKLCSDLEIQKTLSKEAIEKLEQQIAEIREEHKKDTELLSLKVKTLESTKAELAAKEEGLRENLQTLTNEKLETEKQLREKLEEEKKSTQKVIKELKDKMSEQQDKTKEMEIKLMSGESEFSKQKALYEQKITHLETSLEDSKTKEKDYVNEIKTVKKNDGALIKEMGDKCEVQIKEMQGKIDTLNEKLVETEGKLADYEQKFEIQNIERGEEQASLTAKLQESEKLLSDLRAQADALNAKMKEELKLAETKRETESNNLRKRIAELEAEGKSFEEQLKTQKLKSEKEDAILKQKQEFYELKLAESKKQLEETRKAHDSVVQALEAKEKDSANQVTAFQQIENLKTEHVKEIKELTGKLEEEKKTLMAQNEQLGEKTSDLELKLQLLQTDSEKELANLKEQIKALEVTNAKMLLQNRVLDQQKVHLIEASETHYKEIIANLESQMEEKAKKAQDEIHEQQARSEESLAQLRNFYEMEKEKLENRIVEEKEKVEKRYAQQMEEYEIKMKEEQQQHMEEIEIIQNDLKECEVQHQAIIVQLEQENILLKQKVQTLESQVKEAKEQVDKAQSLNTSAIEQQMNSFSEERKDLLEKIDKLSKSGTTKEKQITTLEGKIEALKTEMERKDKAIDEWKKEKVEEKNSLNENLEGLKTKNQQISEEYMQKKLECNKEMALSKQHAEFQETKIKELQAQNTEINVKFEEKLASQKQDYTTQLKEMADKHKQEKEATEQKYEQKRKALKELESNIARQTAKAEKEKAVIQEKCTNLETKKAELEKQYADETATLQAQIAQLKEVLASDKSGLIQENEKLKKRLADIEKEVVEIQSNYDRDKGVWTEKVQFFEQQRDQYRNDLTEAQKKFEATLEQVQKRGTHDKDKLENNQTALITSIEQRYKNQIKEANEAHQKLNNELTQKNKQLEKEIKQLSDRAQIDQRGKISEQGSLERKVSDLTESQEKVVHELEEIKAERDRKVLEFQKQSEKEKETYKGKLQEIETKFKEAENKRSTLVFEFEREKARWAIEKDHLLTQKGEAQLAIEKLEKRKENLMLENEKLKSQRTARKPLYSGATNIPTSFGNPSRYTAMKFKENIGKFAPGDEKQESLETDSNGSSSSKPTVQTQGKVAITEGVTPTK